MYVRAHVGMYVCMYVCACIYRFNTYVDVYIYIYIYGHTDVWVPGVLGLQYVLASTDERMLKLMLALLHVFVVVNHYNSMPIW